jgi:hypothetical protein
MMLSQDELLVVYDHCTTPSLIAISKTSKFFSEGVAGILYNRKILTLKTALQTFRRLGNKEIEQLGEAKIGHLTNGKLSLTYVYQRQMSIVVSGVYMVVSHSATGGFEYISPKMSVDCFKKGCLTASSTLFRHPIFKRLAVVSVRFDEGYGSLLVAGRWFRLNVRMHVTLRSSSDVLVEASGVIKMPPKFSGNFTRDKDWTSPHSFDNCDTSVFWEFLTCCC